MKWQQAVTIIRDLGGLVVGSFMLIFAALSGSTNPYLFTAGLIVFGVPGSISAYHLLARGKPETPATPDSSLPPPSSSSSPSSSLLP